MIASLRTMYEASAPEHAVFFLRYRRGHNADDQACAFYAMRVTVRSESAHQQTKRRNVSCWHHNAPLKLP